MATGHHGRKFRSASCRGNLEIIERRYFDWHALWRGLSCTQLATFIVPPVWYCFIRIKLVIWLIHDLLLLISVPRVHNSLDRFHALFHLHKARRTSQHQAQRVPGRPCLRSRGNCFAINLHCVHDTRKKGDNLLFQMGAWGNFCNVHKNLVGRMERLAERASTPATSRTHSSLLN